MQTERVTFLTTPEGKAVIAARAAARGISLGEYIRRKVEDENDADDTDEAELVAVVEELTAAIPDMKARLERTAMLIEDAITDSDRRLREAGVRK
jgi:KaiC/GvpD/RAD55 family RecA-like ATPase